jgi:hypothetical protein
MLQTATLRAGAVVTCWYDGDQQRALKLLGGGQATYYLRGLGPVLPEFEQDGSQLRWTVDYIRLGGALLAAARPPAAPVTLTLGKAGPGAER